MATTRVQVEGLRETEAALRELGKSLGKAALRRTAKSALQPFDDRWRALAPDDPSTGGNDLRSSGGISTRLVKSQAKQHRKMFRNDRSTIEMFAGPNDRAAVPLEFGTGERVQVKTGKSVGSVSPTPFVRPAWDATKGAMPGAIGSDLWTEIRKSAERKARRDAKRAAKG